ncbi:hypothetical protein V866_003221 [Kwoniella sp. B9012]
MEQIDTVPVEVPVPVEHQVEQVDLVRALESIDNNHPLSIPIPLAIDPIHHPLPSDDAQRQDNDVDDDGQELHEWTREQLHAEIVKLRRLAKTHNNNTPIPTPAPAPDNVDRQQDEVEKALEAVQRIREHVSVLPNELHPALGNDLQNHDHLASTSLHASSSTHSDRRQPGGSSANRKRTKRKRNTNDNNPNDKDDNKDQKMIKRDEGTGKRLEKDRKTELSKCVRIKIRSWLGIGMEESLPHPHLPSLLQDGQEPSHGGIFIPKWNQQLNDDSNVEWINKISNQVYEECLNGLYPKIPQSDINPETIDQTTKTAFVNMCKRYAQENDPKGEERREKYTKKRRRWARKDLKQKRRTKTASDPSFQNLNLPLSALHIDYMSSEYSSSGEDTEGELEDILSKRKELWQGMRKRQMEEDQPVPDGNGKNGWVVGLSEKILEVRTPRWRSETLNDIYKRLDAHATQMSDTRSTSKNVSQKTQTQTTTLNASSPSSSYNIRAGHVAPSHRRFTMTSGIMRKGGLPRDLGEGWMWASGMGGVWPEEAARWIGGTEFDPNHTAVTGADHDQSAATGFSDEPGHNVGIEVNAVQQQEEDHEQEQARLGLVNALEGL